MMAVFGSAAASFPSVCVAVSAGSWVRHARTLVFSPKENLCGRGRAVVRGRGIFSLSLF